MTAEELFDDIKTYCKQNANEELVKKYSRFFKEGYDAYGLSQELMESKLKSLRNSSYLNLNLIYEVSRLLVKSGKYEETSFAYLLLKEHISEFDQHTFREIEHWFEIGIENWAHCDVISGDLISEFLKKNIVQAKHFENWVKSDRKFTRRAVPVSFIKIIDNNKIDTLLKIIEPLMLDKEKPVLQGTGWFLREAHKVNKIKIEEFLIKWKNLSPRIIYQYATEKMSSEEKSKFKKSKT